MAEIDNILERTMWPKDALGRDIAGSKETVTKFTTHMFQDYMTRHYQTPNMLLGVSGKFNERELDRLITRFWSHVPKHRFHGWDRAKDKQTRSRITVAYKDTEQAHLALGFKGFPNNHPKNPIVSVLAAILGGGMSSRLFIEVRERRGLAYYVKASPNTYQDVGSFDIGAGVQVGKIEEALKVIMSELRRIRDIWVDPKELLKAKEYIKGKTTLALEDNQVRLDWYLEQVAFKKVIRGPEEAFARIDKVTARDVTKVARDLFQTKGLSLAVIGPYKSDKHFQKLLHI